MLYIVNRIVSGNGVVNTVVWESVGCCSLVEQQVTQ